MHHDRPLHGDGNLCRGAGGVYRAGCVSHGGDVHERRVLDPDGGGESDDRGVRRWQRVHHDGPVHGDGVVRGGCDCLHNAGRVTRRGRARTGCARRRRW